MKTFDVALSYQAMYVHHIYIEANNEDDAERRAQDWLKDWDNETKAAELAKFSSADEAWEIECMGEGEF